MSGIQKWLTRAVEVVDSTLDIGKRQRGSSSRSSDASSEVPPPPFNHRQVEVLKETFRRGLSGALDAVGSVLEELNGQIACVTTLAKDLDVKVAQLPSKEAFEAQQRRIEEIEQKFMSGSSGFAAAEKDALLAECHTRISAILSETRGNLERSVSLEPYIAVITNLGLVDRSSLLRRAKGVLDSIEIPAHQWHSMSPVSLRGSSVQLVFVTRSAYDIAEAKLRASVILSELKVYGRLYGKHSNTPRADETRAILPLVS